MRKRMIQITALLLILLTLAGCGTTPPDSTGDGSTGSTPGTTPSSQQTEDNYEEKYHLSNPNATVEAQKLYDYLCELPGVNVLSGQQESTWMVM